jgi:hypothetical protein
MYATRGWGEVYRASWRGSRLVLTASIGLGLRLTRRLWLEGGRLHLHTVIQNTGSEPLLCGWGASLNLRLLEEPQVYLACEAGDFLIQASDWPPQGELVFSGERLPRTGWQVHTPSGIVKCGLYGCQLGRFNLTRRGEPISLHLEARSAFFTLAPGQSNAFVQILEVAKLET